MRAVPFLFLVSQSQYIHQALVNAEITTKSSIFSGEIIVCEYELATLAVCHPTASIPLHFT